MEILFFAGIVLLMVATVYTAPKIVRKKFSFICFAIVIVAFYVFIFASGFGTVGHAFLTALCICSVGYAFLLKKKRQHNPDLLTEENCCVSSDIQLRHIKEKRAAKYDFYRHWYMKLVLLNVIAFSLFALANFIH